MKDRMGLSSAFLGSICNLLRFCSWPSSSEPLAAPPSGTPLLLPAVGVEGLMNSVLMSLKTFKAFFAAVDFILPYTYLCREEALLVHVQLTCV